MTLLMPCPFLHPQAAPFASSPIAFGEAYRNAESQAYNLTAGEMNIVSANEKKSAGVPYPATQLVINKEGDQQMELCKNPWKLNNIIVRGSVEK
jgi:hypothetical protein